MKASLTQEDCPLGREVIKQYLPHREPMLLVDRVVEFTDDRIISEIDLTNHSNLFAGHFPDRAILPGVYMIEMAAQSGALLVALSHGFEDGKFIGFSGVDNVKFRRPVEPNETIRIEVKLEKIRLPYYKFTGKLFVDGKRAVVLDFAAALMDF